MQNKTKLKSNICISQVIITVLKTIWDNPFSEVLEIFKQIFILYKTLKSQAFFKIQQELYWKEL